MEKGFFCFGILWMLFSLQPALGNEGFDPSSVLEARIDELTPEGLTLLYKMGLDIVSVDPRERATAFLSLRGFHEYLELLREGFIVQILPKRTFPLESYHTFAEITQELQDIAAANPDLCELQSAGLSVEGRELWFMKISDNVSVEEDEPEFKYISTMHGDEPVGMELLLLLIHHLLDNYGTDEQATFLVNETEIWIMPLMNPDGYVHHSRYNANGYDLNRNFPDRIDDPVNSPDGRQPETQHIMNWAFAHSSVLSANFHTGALVVNYPWDSCDDPYATYAATPDDALFIHQSLTYSSLNPPMYNSPYFEDGITNGVAWYQIFGGMQDWNYHWMGDNEVTIELNDDKWPPYSEIPALWNENRDSMLAYMELCHRGVRGIVTDAFTGDPLAATVRVFGIDHAVYTDPDVGDYSRMLLAGFYRLDFNAPGYIPQTVESVEVTGETATVVNVVVEPYTEPLISLHSQAVDDGGGDGYADPGETVNLSVTLLNQGLEATGVWATLKANSPYVTITQNSTTFPDIPPDQTRSCVGPFELTLQEDAPVGEGIPLALHVHAGGGYGVYLRVILRIGPAPLFYSKDTPIAIPDDYPPGITSNIQVPDSTPIEDLEVFVDISHNWIGDLIVKAISPEGTEVFLHNRSGGSADDIYGWYDSELSVDGPGSLSDFLGEDANGEWSLVVSDNDYYISGTLNAWGLKLENPVNIYGNNSLTYLGGYPVPGGFIGLEVSSPDRPGQDLVVLSGFPGDPSYIPRFGFWLDLSLNGFRIVYNSMTGSRAPLNSQGRRAFITKVWGGVGDTCRFQAIVGNLGASDLEVTNPVDIIVQ